MKAALKKETGGGTRKGQIGSSGNTGFAFQPDMPYICSASSRACDRKRARMAESVDASDLKSDKPKGLCGFNSRSEYS